MNHRTQNTDTFQGIQSEINNLNFEDTIYYLQDKMGGFKPKNKRNMIEREKIVIDEKILKKV